MDKVGELNALPLIKDHIEKLIKRLKEILKEGEIRDNPLDYYFYEDNKFSCKRSDESKMNESDSVSKECEIDSFGVNHFSLLIISQVSSCCVQYNWRNSYHWNCN
jgi:hypothetical protein